MPSGWSLVAGRVKTPGRTGGGPHGARQLESCNCGVVPKCLQHAHACLQLRQISVRGVTVVSLPEADLNVAGHVEYKSTNETTTITVLHPTGASSPLFL